MAEKTLLLLRIELDTIEVPVKIGKKWAGCKRKLKGEDCGEKKSVSMIKKFLSLFTIRQWKEGGDGVAQLYDSRRNLCLGRRNCYPVSLTTTIVQTRRFVAYENRMAKGQSNSRCYQITSVSGQSENCLLSEVQTQTTANESLKSKLSASSPNPVVAIRNETFKSVLKSKLLRPCRNGDFL